MKRMRTSDRMLRYKKLPCKVFTYNLISRTASKRGNKYAKVFATYFGRVQAYTMRTKGGAHEALSLLFQWTSVLDHIIVDISKEKVLGSFHKTCSEDGCFLKQAETYSLWQNAVEGTIRNLKRRAGRKTTKPQEPKRLWDHCL